jgi:hypothetical protein
MANDILVGGPLGLRSSTLDSVATNMDLVPLHPLGPIVLISVAHDGAATSTSVLIGASAWAARVVG